MPGVTGRVEAVAGVAEVRERHARQARDLADRLAAVPGATPGTAPGACEVCGEPVVRVGTDLQETSLVEQALGEHGARYLDRVYTAAEQADSLGRAADGGPGDRPRPGGRRPLSPPWPAATR